MYRGAIGYWPYVTSATGKLGSTLEITQRPEGVVMRRCRRSQTPSIRCIPPLAPLKQKCSDPRMRAAIKFLLAHDLRREFRTEDLSQHLNLSTSRVLHLFNEHFGFSPSQALKAERMRKAKELLLTFMRVKEIMAAVGIHDPSHFMRDFRQMYGQSPSQLRKQLQETPPSNGGHRLKVA